AAVLLWLGPVAENATKIERLITPGGIEVWLVRDPTVPLISLNFGFNGGSTQDPADRGGTANMMVSLLDEGAGDIDAKAFHELLERKAIELSFNSGRDTIRGTLRTLKENQDEACELLRLSMIATRFDTAAVERIRAQIIARLQRGSTNPNEISSRTWWGTAFPDHPYGRPGNGTPESVARVTVDDMKDQLRRVFARDTLKIGMVGAVDSAPAARLIDRAFGALPAKSDLKEFPEVMPQGIGRRIVVDLDVPQAVVMFGGPGIKRSDPDFMAAYIVNHILGGGAFSSRLYVEVREKRGLAYGISDSLLWLDRTALLLGHTPTPAHATPETLPINRAQINP